ncbi:sodium:solute symporter [Streptomyces sp. UNOC14_S4]|uniref:sodium:solute symporter n=1 Tax=Streptomyces sp. UNOC14_S4 TaxID=2872340 RepID=UPI001E56CA4C|nr:sodium:solute symporter [Streptomyces sp. UNOC14_S4]MCC3771039.1 sodium:solute symporter [Streptomyces sp. UNOC14_S4]
MLAIGWWGMRRSATAGDFLVAGRRLGPAMYSGTMAAVVLGGASTIGGVGLGYRYGLSGAWMVFAIGLGLLALSLVFSARISRLKVYTVGEMLDLRYGRGPLGAFSGVVMWAYTLMLAVTSTIAYATIFGVVLGLDRTPAIVLGGVVVVGYSTLGGMWSITLTDLVQFVVKTVGVLLVLLPVAVVKAGGFARMEADLPDGFFSPTGIGARTVLTYVLVYSFGMLIGQDIWQRVLTARDARTARAGGTVAGTYCLLYALGGAVIGTAARVLHPHLGNPDDAFVTLVRDLLPTGARGLVLAAALSAVMSTSSGALIACATVVNHDLRARLRPRADGNTGTGRSAGADEVRGNRLAILVLGALVTGVAVVLGGVVEALTVAYDLLVGGLLVPVLGGLLWRRGTATGALAALGVGSATVVTLMALLGVQADEPVLYGLPASLAAYVAVSLAGRPTDPAVLAAWRARAADGDAPGADGPHAPAVPAARSATAPRKAPQA